MSGVLKAVPLHEALAALVQDCRASGAMRHVALLRTGLLPPALSRPHHHRLARAALDPLLRADRATWYDGPDGMAAVAWRGPAPDALARATAQLRHMLPDGIDTPAVADLLRVFVLPAAGPELLAVLQPVLNPAMPGGFAPDASERLARHLGPPVLGPPVLDPAGLAVLERHMAAMDVARFVRRMPVRRVLNDDVAWERRTLSVTELADTVMPGCNLMAAPWLFRRLTRAMDRRMLALLAAPSELAGMGPFSIDLNVASVVSQEFLRFDAALPAALRGRVVLNIGPADIVADLPAFTFARDFARVRGYRVLLRALSAAMLPLWRLDRIEVDWVELQWEPALAAQDLSAFSLGGAEWVLAYPEDQADADPAAAEWARRQHVVLMQSPAAWLRAGG